MIVRSIHAHLALILTSIDRFNSAVGSIPNYAFFPDTIEAVMAAVQSSHWPV